MLTVEERLKALMMKGYDVTIECKGIGRSQEMTFEASVHRSAPSPDDKSDFSWLVVQSQAIGSTLNELLDNLEKDFGEAIQ